MKKYKLLLFLLLALFACNDNKDSYFETSIDELKLESKAVSGGAMLKYVLPSDRNIFAMNIRYTDTNGKAVLKSAGYSGNSILLDGFTRAQSATAKVTMVDNYGKESKPIDFNFTTEDSAPWAFFETLEVNTSWDGFTIKYGESSIATGMVHVFYLGTNSFTGLPDTILVEKGSFPINKDGDSVKLVPKQANPKNTVVIRTEDFSGFRVRQEIYRDIDSYPTEKFKLTADNIFDNGRSIENDVAKTGIKYLFDGDLIGQLRIDNPADILSIDPKPADKFGAYFAKEAIGKSIIIDLKEERIPALVRLYSLVKLDPAGYPIPKAHEFGPEADAFYGVLGKYWQGSYLDKGPCKVDIWGSNDPLAATDDPAAIWSGVDNKPLAKMDQDPETESPWNLPAPGADNRAPLYYDMDIKPSPARYRYLKIEIKKTFKPSVGYNPHNCVHIQELEVYVKKD